LLKRPIFKVTQIIVQLGGEWSVVAPMFMPVNRAPAMMIR